MLKVTAQQRANAIEARDVMWPSVPPCNVTRRLLIWRTGNGSETETPDCGTVACFGGWCQHWPAFQAQFYGERRSAKEKVGLWGVGPAAATIFGDAHIFDIRGHHPSDDEVTGLTDHALVTYRLNWLLENSEVVA